jgi:peptide/nickel transport system ATP-binding protein
MASQEHLVCIRDLTLHFRTYEGRVKALENVNLRIERGETLGVVGETGCGKTVASRAIMGLLAPNAIVVSGRIDFTAVGNVLEMPDEQLCGVRGNQIAMIFQEPGRALNPTMMIGDQIGEALLLHFGQRMIEKGLQLVGDSSELGHEPFWKRLILIALGPVHRSLLRAEKKDATPITLRFAKKVPLVRAYRTYPALAARREAVEMLRKVRMPNPERAAWQYPHELSGGMKQRAMIAMALVCSPTLLIADEPTTALDVTTQLQILKLLNELKRQFNMTILLITHNLGVVAELSSRVAVMYAGTIVETADVRSLFRNPLHPYTIGLLNAAHEVGGTKELQEIPGMVPNLVNPPSGCRFHPRCVLAEEMCSMATPKLVQVRQQHFVACFPVQRKFAKLDVVSS